MRAVAYMLAQKNDSASLEWKKILRFFNNETLKKTIPDVYYSTVFIISENERVKGNYPEAYKILTNALNDLDSTNIEGKTKIYSSLAELNMQLGNNAKAEELIRKALKFKNNGILEINCLYYTMGDYYINKNIDSSMYYYKKAEPFFNSITNKIDYNYLRCKIASCYVKKGEISKAKTILKDVESYSKNHKFSLLSEVYLLLSEIASYEDKPTLEYNYLLKSDSLMVHDAPLTDKLKLYNRYISYYEKVKNFDKKLHFDLMSKKIEDSINNRERIFLTQELEVEYETELNKNKVLSQQELIKTQKKQNKWLFGGLIMLLALLGISILFYKQRVLAQKRLLEKQQELASEKINKVLEAEKAKSMQSHLEGQNKERERIAKDLHDNISGNLAAIKLKMSELQNQTEDIQQIVTSLDDTYNEVRSISHDLTPKKVSINTFTELVEQLIAFRNTSQLCVNLDLFPIDELNRIPENIQIETYSILQELLTNMHKHSKADKGIICITLHDNYINILVEDNGIGFKKDLNKEGIGLKNIKSRIKSLKGNFYIENQKGTIVNINIPI